jgi:hypothetical protein
MRDRISQVSAEIVGNSPTDFEVFIKAEATRWGKVIRDLNIKME